MYITLCFIVHLITCRITIIVMNVISINSIKTFAILYFLNTVPSVDSSTPVTIQPVVTRNMLNITVFVNVRTSVLLFCMHHICTQSQRNTFCCINNSYVKQKCFSWYMKMFNTIMCLSVYSCTCDLSGPVLIMITCIVHQLLYRLVKYV